MEKQTLPKWVTRCPEKQYGYLGALIMAMVEIRISD